MHTAHAVTRRQKQRDQARADIREAARTIFVRDGYTNFSMRKLAAQVGYSAGALYLYFRNKDELFHSLVDESFARLADSFDALNHGRTRPVDRLKRGLRLYVDWGVAHPNDYEIAFLQPDPMRRPYRTHRAFDVLRALVAASYRGGKPSAQRTARDSEAIWSAVHGITALLIQRPTFRWHSQDAVVRQVIDSAVNGALAPRRPGHRSAP